MLTLKSELPRERSASNFSLQYHHLITSKDYGNQRPDQ